MLRILLLVPDIVVRRFQNTHKKIEIKIKIVITEIQMICRSGRF